MTDPDPLNDNSSTADPTQDDRNLQYPKGFKFILPKAFRGDRQELEPWLFNLEQYFDNTELSVDKWLRVAISNMTGNVTLWWRICKS